ncbi:PREDICTED: rho guanine nucleotide exchange factor 26-like, partial [Nanorana parkeri]|uniref:rho guanine nucleotide exchange factor 26-like n=1 Tax=Nanorana parkeri TaxID=125878 RepID=UPI000854C486
MEAESEVEFSSDLNFVPLWRRASPHVPQGEGLYYSRNPRPRPQSYTSPNGLLVTDFPVEDRQCFTVTQPAERITSSPESNQGGKFLHSPNGKIQTSPSLSSLEYKSPNHKRSSQVLKVVSNNSISFTTGDHLSSVNQKPMLSQRTSGNVTLTPEREQIVFGSSTSFPSNGMVTASNCSPPQPLQATQAPDIFASKSLPGSPKPSLEDKQSLQRTSSNPDKSAIILSTNSPVSLKAGAQQIIPKGLASGIKVSNKNSNHNNQNTDSFKRLLKTRSMVETSSPRLVVPSEDGDAENETDSPGTLHRGLRSTSYRRAVVSGVEFNNSSDRKKSNRMSQPILKAVVEDKEKFYSLGRIKGCVRRLSRACSFLRTVCGVSPGLCSFLRAVCGISLRAVQSFQAYVPSLSRAVQFPPGLCAASLQSCAVFLGLCAPSLQAVRGLVGAGSGAKEEKAITIVPRHWNTVVPQTVWEWIAELCLIMRFEELTASLCDLQPQCTVLWAPWILYMDSAAFLAL